jgi:hypothetical protein
MYKAINVLSSVVIAVRLSVFEDSANLDWIRSAGTTANGLGSIISKYDI